MTPDIAPVTVLADAPVQSVNEPSVPRLAYREVGCARLVGASGDANHASGGAAGAGTVFLLHGGGRSLMDWGPVVCEVAGRVRVVAVDLPGHGQSEEGSWELSDVLDGLDAVMAAAAQAGPLGVGVTVAGHSVGGVLALAWAERQRRITGVVNVDGFPASIDFAGYRGSQLGFMARALLGGVRESSPGFDRLLRACLPRLSAQTVGGTCPLPEQLPNLVDTSVPAKHAPGVMLALQAAMRPRADGRLAPRASAATRAGMGRCISQLHLPALYRSCPVPSLTLDGLSHEREAQELGLPWVADQLRDAREQMWQEFQTVVADGNIGKDLAQRVPLDAGHDMLFTHPGQVAKHILAGHGAGLRHAEAASGSAG